MTASRCQELSKNVNRSLAHPLPELIADCIASFADLAYGQLAVLSEVQHSTVNCELAAWMWMISLLLDLGLRAEQLQAKNLDLDSQLPLVHAIYT